MTYQVLARKWRPQDFSSVVGQEPVVTALRNALTESRVAQAYLFSGIRGVGKTSVARILAKALNCDQGPTDSPCGECPSCTEIAAGSTADLDFIEVDAATYSKVEQVRELTESLKYGPARDRYKIVVIDEIHRLSRQAFDALLKIVEEPPDHLVFIFATTESEAVPATLLSRCQEFRFRRVPSQLLADHLRTLSDAEAIRVSDNALRLIARAGDGSVRDSVALLDQLATFGSSEISDDQANSLLGGVDHALFLRLLDAIVGGASAEVVAVVQEVEQRGWDPRHVFTEFLRFCRDALHLALGGDPVAVDLPLEEAVRLQERGTAAGYETFLRLLHHLLGSENAVRRSEVGSLALEIAWLRAAELPKLTRIEEILAGAPAPGSEAPDTEGGQPGSPNSSAPSARSAAPAAAVPPAVAATSPVEATIPAPRIGTATLSQDGSPEALSPPLDDEPPPELTLAPESPLPEQPPSGDPPTQAAVANGESLSEPPQPEPFAAAGGDPDLERFLQQISLRKQPLAAHLAEADRLEFSDHLVKIYAPLRDPWLTNALARQSNRRVMAEAMSAVWGEGCRFKLLASKAQPAPKQETSPPAPEVINNPRIQAVLDIFGGTVQAVEEQDSGEQG